MGRVALALVLALVTPLAAGCGGDAANGPAVTQVELSTASATLAVGATVQLTATARDSSGAAVAAAIGWSVDAPAVASVVNGLVTGLSPGAATVTARAGSASASAAITVSAHTAALSLTRAGGGGGRVTSQPAGIDCDFPEGTSTVPCSAVFSAGASVQLTAAPHAGSRSDGFGPPCSADPCTLTVDHDLAVEIRFAQGVHLAVAVTGDGRVTSAPAGIDCGGAATACAADWPKGTAVVLTAAPGFSTLAATWGGACAAAAGATCSLSLDADASVPVTFAPAPIPLHVTITGGGRVVSAPAGIDCATGVCSAGFPPGTLVALQALPAAGNVLGAWSGACTGSGSCALDLNKESSVGAAFVPGNSTVTVTVTGSGRVTTTPAGIDCPGTCSAVFSTLTALLLQPAPAAGSGLRAWGGGCSGGGACTLQLAGDVSVTADFTTLKTLTLTLSGRGSVASVPAGIACPGTCSAQLANGAAIQLVATPADASSALGAWSGPCTGSGLCSFTLAGDTAAGAAFVEVVPLTVGIAAGSGSVSSSPPGILCPPACTASYVAGTQVALTPHGGSGGWLLDSWSGDCAGAAACSVTMSAAHSVAASFAHRIAATSIDVSSAAPFASVVVTGGGFDPAGSAISVLLVPRAAGGLPVTVPVVAATETKVGFVVPPLTSTTGAPLSGATDLQIVQLSGPDLMTSALIPGPVVSALPSLPPGLATGKLTAAWLLSTNEVIATLIAQPSAATAVADLQALSTALAQLRTQVQAITANPATGFDLATTDGKPFRLDAALVAQVDLLVLAYLNAVTTALDGGTIDLPVRSAAGTDCAAGVELYGASPAIAAEVCSGQRYDQQYATQGGPLVEGGAKLEAGAAMMIFGAWAAAGAEAASLAGAGLIKAFEIAYHGVSPAVIAFAMHGKASFNQLSLKDMLARTTELERLAGVPILSSYLMVNELVSKASEIAGPAPATAPAQGLIMQDPTVHPGACGRAVLGVYQAAGNKAAATMALACGQSTVPASAAAVAGGLSSLGGGTPDAGTSDAGSPDAGHPDGGAADGGSVQDGGSPDGGGICCCWFDATHYDSNGHYCPCWNCAWGGSGPAGSFCQPQCVAAGPDQCSACP